MKKIINKLIITIIFAVLGILFIILLNSILSNELAQKFLGATELKFTIQNTIYILFFIGIGEVVFRIKSALKESGHMNKGFLPEDDSVILQSKNLVNIRKKVSDKYKETDSDFIPYLIDLSILQFQSSQSVEQTIMVLNSSLELLRDKIDLRYQVLRYITWVIPTTGFIGTVVGISNSLSTIKTNQENLLTEASAKLSVAFDTTLVALICAAILTFLVFLAQKLEEESLNEAGDYVLKNLINKLYSNK